MDKRRKEYHSKAQELEQLQRKESMVKAQPATPADDLKKLAVGSTSVFLAGIVSKCSSQGKIDKLQKATDQAKAKYSQKIQVDPGAFYRM